MGIIHSGAACWQKTSQLKPETIVTNRLIGWAWHEKLFEFQSVNWNSGKKWYIIYRLLVYFLYTQIPISSQGLLTLHFSFLYKSMYVIDQFIQWVCILHYLIAMTRRYLGGFFFTCLLKDLPGFNLHSTVWFFFSLFLSSGRCVTLSIPIATNFSQLIPKYEQKYGLFFICKLAGSIIFRKTFIRTQPKEAFITHISHRYKCICWLRKMRCIDKSNDKVTNVVTFQLMMMMVMCINEWRPHSSVCS